MEAARTLPATQAELHAIAGFTARNARQRTATWLRALSRARNGAEDTLPEAAAQSEGPPPASRWAERDPAAARRLESARTVVAAIADEHTVPSENLLQPDAVRRLAWSPPTEPTVAAVAGYPHITVPAGYFRGLPIGVSFFGRAWSEPTLIKLAYAYEQATKHRRPPTFAATADMK